MSGDPEQEYFSDGVSEDIITDLSKVSALSVTARNTAFTFKGRAVDVRQVAREVGVAYLLEGSVRKAGGRVRITAQLTDGATGNHVWAERYDRDLDDIFALQDEISEAIVTALKVKLLPDEKKAIETRGTANAEAYDLYLMARNRYVGGNRGDPDWGEGIARLCRRATEIDPNYAEAWSMMALGQVGSRFHQATADDGSAAVERALALNPDLAVAHVVKARILSNAGRHAEAAQEAEAALRLDVGRTRYVQYLAGLTYWSQRRFEEASRCFEAALALDETDFESGGFLIGRYFRRGDAAELRRAATITLAHVETALAQDRNNALAIAHGARALAALGDKARSREWIERALLIEPDDFVVRWFVALALAAHLKEPEAAVEMVIPALEKITRGYLDAVRLTAEFNPIRDHPRVQSAIAAALARHDAHSAAS
jgi:adenylate cyclase